MDYFIHNLSKSKKLTFTGKTFVQNLNLLILIQSLLWLIHQENSNNSDSSGILSELIQNQIVWTDISQSIVKLNTEYLFSIP